MATKAVALLSGGLDSSLAVKMVLEQGVALEALHYTSPFCTCTAKSNGCNNQAVAVARSLGLPIKIINKGPDYLTVLRNPRYGYGRGMNPCIDCRIYMFRKARDYMNKTGAEFLVTGEVIGQRPKSQKRQLLALIEQESGLAGRIVRPLTARNLPASEPEKKGIINRQRLLGISGRSRKQQLAMAAAGKLPGSFCVAGGCLLTDKHIAERLRDLFKHQDEITPADLRLLRFGRHFRIDSGLKIIIGKNEQENILLNNSYQNCYNIVNPVNFSGPTALISCPEEETSLWADKAGQLIIGYSGKKENSYTLNINKEKEVTLAYQEELFNILKKRKI